MKNLVFGLLFIGLIVACQSNRSEGSHGQPIGDALYLEDLLSVKNHDELIQRFGSANVKKDTMIPGPEGTTLKGTLLFPGTDDEIEIYWESDSTYQNLRSARILAKFKEGERMADFNTRWQSRTGLKLGMSFAELLELNEKPFILMGFGWDYGGYISDWQKGKLDGKQLQARLMEEGNTYDKLTEAEVDSIMGDKPVSASFEPLKKIKLSVSELGIFVPVKE